LPQAAACEAQPRVVTAAVLPDAGAVVAAAPLDAAVAEPAAPPDAAAEAALDAAVAVAEAAPDAVVAALSVPAVRAAAEPWAAAWISLLPWPAPRPSARLAHATAWPPIEWPSALWWQARLFADLS